MSSLKADDPKTRALKKLKPPASWSPSQKQAWKEALRFISLSPAKQAAEIKKEGDDIVQRAVLYAKLIDDFSANIAMRADYIDGREMGAAYRELADRCDFALAKLKECGANLWPDQRAAKTRTRDLTVEVTAPMRRTSDFIKALENDIALSDENPDEMHEVLGDYAHHLHTLTGHFTELCERYPDAAKGIGKDYPNWPYLLSARKSVPEAFKVMAKNIALGETCIIEASEQGRYQWNPLNRYMFEILRSHQWLKRAGKHRDGRTLDEEILKTWSHYCEKPSPLQITEAKIFTASMDLPPLTRSRKVAAQWVDTLILPIIDAREPDLKEVRAFSVACKHANNHEPAAIRTKLRTLLIDSLLALARQGS